MPRENIIVPPSAYKGTVIEAHPGTELPISLLYKAFKENTTDMYGTKMSVDGIQLLDFPRQPKLWLDPWDKILQSPWYYIGEVRYRDEQYFGNHYFRK